MGHSELHNEWADSNIVGVLTTAGTVVLWPGLCFADDAARISNSALQAAERLAWLRNCSAAFREARLDEVAECRLGTGQ